MPFPGAGRETFVNASIGIAIYPDDGDSADGLVSAADAAMYRAKESGRNRYCAFTPGIAEGTRARLQLGAELRRAFEREEFRLAYQPRVALVDRSLRGAEALLRWEHPERGMVLPDEFVPVLEESGLIVAVGEWVLRRVCADIRGWSAAGRRPLPVSVNLSARQFQSRQLDRSIRAAIDEFAVDPGLIELEITESHLMQDPEDAMRALKTLAEAGVRIAIDDFGTGYSSLSYLTRFPVSALKIDRSFVKDIEHDAHDAVIVRTIVEMAHTLGFLVIAEGVESENQLAFLHALGCEQAQGFLFSRPMTAARLESLLSLI
jgi:EAL domain-containing protein (putative c-di-GMP-specific phosphodiesterase class I)